MAISVQTTLDCADPEKLGAFWAAALSDKQDDPPPGFESWPAFLTAGQPRREMRPRTTSRVSDEPPPWPAPHSA